MSLGLGISAVVLAAAFMHAAWNALVKTGTDRLATVAMLSTVWLGVGGVAAVLLPAPQRASWPFLAATVALHTVYLLALLRMYRLGDLSHVYPISRGSAPLLLAVLSAWAAHEVLPPQQWAGVAVVSAGVLSLAVQGHWPRREERHAIGAALFTAVLIVAYTLVDGLGVRRTDNAFAYSAWLFFCTGWPWALLLGWLRWRQPERVPLRMVAPGVLGGVLSLLAYALVIWALQQGAIAPVAALRETGVIFAALIGTLKLGEPLGTRRVVASLLVAAGVALINLPG